jgi:hypothetical protein
MFKNFKNPISWLAVICSLLIGYFLYTRAHSLRLEEETGIKKHSGEIQALSQKLIKTHKGDFLVKNNGEVFLITASIPGKSPVYFIRRYLNRQDERIDSSNVDFVLLNTKDVVIHGESSYADVAYSFAQQQ